MPPDTVAFGLAALLAGGAGYAEWVAWAPSGNQSSRRAPRWETLAIHIAAVCQLALATALVLAS